MVFGNIAQVPVVGVVWFLRIGDFGVLAIFSILPELLLRLGYINGIMLGF